MNLGTNKLHLYSNGKRYRLITGIQGISNKYVVYYTDLGSARLVEYDKGANVLSPNFTPSKDGWTFVGWREDTTPSTDVLTSKTMGTESIKLYAVYKRTVTLTYNGNGATSGSVSKQSGTAYYNASGSTRGATFTLASNGFSRTNYNFTGWNLGAVGATITLTESKTAYAQWELASRPYYAVQNGKRVNLPNASIDLYGDYWGQATGNIVANGIQDVWGAQFRVRSTNTETGVTVDTGNMSTEQCAYVTVTSFSYDWGVNYWHGATFVLYGDGSEITRWDEVRDVDNDIPGTTTQTFYISSYSNIRIIASSRETCNEDEAIAINVGFVNIQFHN